MSMAGELRPTASHEVGTGREVLPGALSARIAPRVSQEESQGMTMPTECDQPFPVVRVSQIPTQQRAQRWLVEQLWGASSVGLIGRALISKPGWDSTWP
jgi:hypothetical protein